jgi:hypothetical protein
MLKDNYTTGNKRYEGYCIDLLKAMFSLFPKQFDYEIYLVPDGQFGAKNESGEWNGIMKELIDGVSQNNRRFTRNNLCVKHS